MVCSSFIFENFRFGLLCSYLELCLLLFCRSAESRGVDNQGRDFNQITFVNATFNVKDVDTLPPEFQPCVDLGDGTCAPPLYTAEVKANVTDEQVSIDFCFCGLTKLWNGLS